MWHHDHSKLKNVLPDFENKLSKIIEEILRNNNNIIQFQCVPVQKICLDPIIFRICIVFNDYIIHKDQTIEITKEIKKTFSRLYF